ncbi:PREDICTED: kinetochore protein Spc25 [Hipposideros armiger]|uniref:Kinetochore protein SPC25 n=1 Tax=Hipposideros armiger TaxID=186990 RepID=A0A8B7SFL5_HIPAR|nr:PREDICTED: kinetochore protein Spc25 [Hipposideros armiger]
MSSVGKAAGLRPPGEALSNKLAEDELPLLDKNINEFWNNFKVSASDICILVVAMRETYRDMAKAFTEKLSVKLKEEERMIQIFLEYQNQISRQNKLIQEKKENLLRLIAEVKDKKQEMEVLTANVQDLKEEYARKKEIISTTKKASEERLKRLQKSVDLYKDRLGLEIRKIYGDKLQFIFTNIDPKHPDSPFMFCLHLNEARDYEVSDSTPHLECLSEFQENVRKTKNFSAFLANVRKAFSTMVYN